MAYHFTDKSRESEPHALPDVEVFENRDGCPEGTRWSGVRCSQNRDGNGCPHGWFYAHGFPGCLWDSDPVGPFDSEAEALKEARDAAGFEESAPELWTLADDSELGAVKCPNPPFPHTFTADWTKCVCWGSEQAAIGSIDHFGGLGTLHAVRLSDDDARRWGK